MATKSKSRLLGSLELLESRVAPAADLNVTWIERTPRLNYDAAQNVPNPGQIVTFNGHIRNWDAATPSADYRWELDGIPVASGTLTGLAAGEERVVTWQWPWQPTPHRIRLVVDPADAVAESTEFNNSVEDRTNGLAVGFWVEQSVYDYFQHHQRDLGVGANSWEDWAQRQIGLWNFFNANAVYPTTPQGVTDRIRLDKITIVPDGALPLHGGLATNNPDTTDRTVDLQWGFEADGLAGSFYADTTHPVRGNAFFLEESLIHEMGHARYLIDAYSMDIANNASTTQLQIMEGGAPVAGTALMPFVAFNEVLHYNRGGGIMSGPWSNVWSPHEAAALERIAGQRASQGNMNAPGNIGVYLTDLPAQNHLHVMDENGAPLAGADVRMFRAVCTGGLYGKLIDGTPDYTLTADATGTVDLPQNPFTDTAYSYWDWVPRGAAVVRIAHSGRIWYRFIEIADFNLEFRAGHTSDGHYTIALPPPGSGPRVEVSGYGTKITNGDLVPGALDHTDFGAVPLGGTLTRTFVIRNSGDGFLQLTGNPRVQVIGSTDFRVTIDPHDHMGTDHLTSFQVRYAPTTAGSDAATLRIATSAGTFEFGIAGIAATPAPPGTADVGQPYRFDFGPHADGASMFSATGLPAGLAMNVASGVLSGTPATGSAGTYAVTVSRQNLGGAVALGTYSLTVGTAPTISSIVDQSTPMNAAIGPISFTIGDVGTTASNLIVSATSSNPTLVPVANIVFGGAGANRNCTITPALNRSGSTTITVTVTDGDGLTAQDTFVLNVTNAAPVVGDIPNQSLPVNSVLGPVSFTFGDAETPGNLTLSAASSNPTLVPVANVAFGGNGASRTVTVTPVPGQTGQATITITVRDPGGLTAQDSFLLTVIVPNALPTISDIADQTRTNHQTIGPLAFTVGDMESPSSLTVTARSSNPALVPAANVVLGGSGSARTIAVTPVAGQTGTSTITITVTDAGGLTAQDTFVVTVTAPAMPTTPSGLSHEFAVGSDVGTTGTATLHNADQSVRYSIAPFGSNFSDGVRVAAADFTGDGVADLVVGTGPGRDSLVIICDGATGAMLQEIRPFEMTFPGGVYVAAGDITGDGTPDLVITPDEGGGPRVRLFDGRGFGQLADFYGIDDPNFRGGARASIGDLNGDGRGDLVIAAGFGGGPRIAAIDGTRLGSNGGPKLFGDFYAFEQTLRNGTYVAVGDFNGDGFADLAAGGGPGGGPRVLILDGHSLVQGGGMSPVANFFAGDLESRKGVRLAVKDLDGDEKADLIAGNADSHGRQVVGYLGKYLIGNLAASFSIDAFSGFHGGVFVG